MRWAAIRRRACLRSASIVACEFSVGDLTVLTSDSLGPSPTSDKIEVLYFKINYVQHTLAFEVLDLCSRGFPDFIAKRARLAPAAARGAFIPLHPPMISGE